jgi:hypothetical protein
MKKEQSIRLNSSIKIPCFKIPTKTQEVSDSVDDIERIGASVKRAAKMLDLSERHVWTLVKEEKIRSVKSGTRTIVSVRSIRDYVDGKEE